VGHGRVVGFQLVLSNAEPSVHVGMSVIRLKAQAPRAYPLV
jgi:hypothetical protein